MYSFIVYIMNLNFRKVIFFADKKLLISYIAIEEKFKLSEHVTEKKCQIWFLIRFNDMTTLDPWTTHYVSSCVRFKLLLDLSN